MEGLMAGDSGKQATLGVHTKKAANPQVSPGETDAQKKEKLLQQQHEANVKNAGIIIQHAMETVRTTGVDKAVIEILKTVRHWPSTVDKTNPGAFEPAFNATEISAEEIMEEGFAGIDVSFTYAGKVYDIVARVKENSSSDITFGTITLRENGERVFSMETVQDQRYEHVSFRGLNAFKYGKWIENVAAIEKEIELHRAQAE
jgi:hypothetical protein